jgi:hypothetical protein
VSNHTIITSAATRQFPSHRDAMFAPLSLVTSLLDRHERLWGHTPCQAANWARSSRFRTPWTRSFGATIRTLPRRYWPSATPSRKGRFCGGRAANGGPQRILSAVAGAQRDNASKRRLTLEQRQHAYIQWRIPFLARAGYRCRLCGRPPTRSRQRADAVPRVWMRHADPASAEASAPAA